MLCKVVLSVECRPEGWPWGKAGLPDEPPPEKQKKKGFRRKRSTSPVSRDANPTDDDGNSEVVKPATKRAKRGGGVGAAKVVKRPARRGEICTQTYSCCHPACSYSAEVVSEHQLFVLMLKSGQSLTTPLGTMG